MAKAKQAEPTFEAGLKRLEEVLDSLEHGDLALEEDAGRGGDDDQDVLKKAEAADKAEREQLTYRGFLAEVLMAECEDRDRRRADLLDRLDRLAAAEDLRGPAGRRSRRRTPGSGSRSRSPRV